MFDQELETWLKAETVETVKFLVTNLLHSLHIVETLLLAYVGMRIERWIFPRVEIPSKTQSPTDGHPSEDTPSKRAEKRKQPKQNRNRRQK